MNKKLVKRAELNTSLLNFWSDKFWQTLSLGVLNLFIAIRITSQTCISGIFISYFLLAFIGYSLAFFKKKSSLAYWYGLGLFPLVLNLLFLINFLGSADPYKETYSYREYVNKSSNSFNSDEMMIFPFIVLEKNTYSEYLGIRTFISKHLIDGGNITYTFETGLFGVPVVKERRFHTGPM